jgi:ankyrin
MLGKTEIVRLLLQNGSNPMIRAGTGDTALHFAVRQDHIDTVYEILGRDEYGQLLYPPEDSINWIMPEGATALTFAVYKESAKMVQILLDAGADPDACGPSGVTPLLTAASRSLDDILVILLDAGANPNSATVEGITPIHAVNTSRSAQNLIAAGSDLSAKIYQKNKYNFPVGATPLRVIVDTGKSDIVKVLARSCTREQFHVKAFDGKSALEATIRPYRPELSSILTDALEDLSTYG